MNKTEIRRYLNVIRRAVSLLEAELDNDGTMDELISGQASVTHEKLEVAPIAVSVPEPVVPEKNEDREKHLKDLMLIDCWPEAIPQILVTTPTDKDNKSRAVSVMDMLLTKSIEGLNVLDYGCGEGWITQEAKRRGADNVVGYDPVKSDKWKDLTGPSFIDSLEVLQKDFFDVVILFDVLDHCLDPQLVMDKILYSMKKSGIVYVRCHPWTSRHASHLVKHGINKAYMHMFLSWKETENLIGEKPMFTRNEKNPVESYRWWFKNFKIVKERMIKEPVNDFFKHPDFKTLLTNEQNILDIDDFLLKMQIQFVDYILQPKV